MKAINVLLLVILGLLAQGRADETEDLMAGIGEALMSSFPASSLTTMQSQFTGYLANAERTMLNNIVSLGDKFAQFDGMNLSNILPDTSFDLSDSVDDLYEKYCGGFSLYRGGFVPSVLLGPTVNITLETGTCTLVWSDDYTTKSVVCSSPSVSYVKTPTTYVHKHFKPAEFSTGACILKKEITQGSEKVLYSGGNDVIFPSIHEFEKALEDGFMGLWDSASNATGSAEGSVLDVLGVGDWKIVTTS